ncbi:hypothetical protein YK48G_19890 [Lentilactobacillus fungorum]|uniref:Lipoprotein n=1 Tax=Lentilactobacillus fungorum TaxID=2201250 RepID=A0ABQ3W1W2_9LACO|nr:hypothetical protein [Lentilactobacillus fungorum]GHP14564.1 hypothetical protein YK48G_19890 [Lentilactobacillus fungorum]
MKKLLIAISVSFAGLMLLAGCKGNQADLNNTPKKSNNSSQKLDQLLSPAEKKVPADDSSNQSSLISQFYQSGGRWHWKLSSSQSGTIDDSQVNSLKSTGTKYVYQLKLKSHQNKHYTLKFNWINGGHQAYTIDSNYHNFHANFILADANQRTDAWQDGAPQVLQGTWATAYTTTGSSQTPYTKRFLMITESTTSSVTNQYDQNHRLYNSSTDLNNDQVSYQLAGQDTYLLKSYSSGHTPTVYQLTLLSSNQIRVSGLTSTPLTLSKSATMPTTDQNSNSTTRSQSSAANSSSSSSQAATTSSHSAQLTDQQLVNWVWPEVKALYPNTNVQSTDFTYLPQKRAGMLYLDVLENHSATIFKNHQVDPNTNPKVASFRVNSTGQLEEMNPTTGNWTVVSDTYGG